MLIVDKVGGVDREVKLQKLVNLKLQNVQDAQSSGNEVVKEQVSKIVYAILSVKDFM
jgi:hypothetical protein